MLGILFQEKKQNENFILQTTYKPRGDEVNRTFCCWLWGLCLKGCLHAPRSAFCLPGAPLPSSCLLSSADNFVGRAAGYSGFSIQWKDSPGSPTVLGLCNALTEDGVQQCILNRFVCHVPSVLTDTPLSSCPCGHSQSIYNLLWFSDISPGRCHLLSHHSLSVLLPMTVTLNLSLFLWEV